MKIRLVIITLILSLNIFGQAGKYDFGPENIPVKDLELQEVIGGEADYFFVHKINTEEKPLTHFIQKVDRKTLLPIDTKEVLLVEENAKIELVRLVYSNDEFTAIVIKNKKKSKTVSVNAISFDASSVIKIKDTELESFEMESYYTPFVDVKFNSITHKLLLKITAAKTEPQGMFSDFFLFDLEKGVKIWEKSFNESFKDKTPVIRDNRINNGIDDTPFSFELDNENNLHYTYLAKVQGSMVKEYVYDLHYKFVNTATSAEKDVVLSVDNKVSRWDIQIVKNKNKTVSVIGLFTGQNPKSLVKEIIGGVFVYLIDNEKGEIISKSFYNRSEFDKGNLGDNNPKGLNKRVTIDEAIAIDDYAVIIGHKFINSTVEHFDQKGARTNPVNDYMIGDYYDIFVMKVNQNGLIEYYTQLPFSSRLQHAGENHIVKQFVECFYNNNLYLLHNEHPETTTILESGNKQSALPQVFGSAKHLVCNKVNLKDGTYKRTVIIIPEKNRFTPILFNNYNFSRPKGTVIYNMFKDELLLPIGNGKKMERFLKITLD